MIKSLVGSFMLFLAIGPIASGQIMFNEIHGYGNGTPPFLQGDYVELWNQGPTPIDLAGYKLALWQGSTGVPTLLVIPSGIPGQAGTWMPGHCFYVFEEGGILGQPLSDPNIPAGTPGMRIGASPFSSGGNNGAYLLDPNNVFVDYIYLARGLTLPSAAPNLPVGGAWTLGNIAPNGIGNGHLQRLTNTNHHSFADWGQDITGYPGTPGAVNTTGAAMQTPVGACVPGVPATFQVNQAQASLDFDGVQAYPDRKATLSGFVTPRTPFAFTVNLNSSLIGHGFDVFYHVGQAVTPAGLGVVLSDGQIGNINGLDPTLTSMNGGFVPYPGGPIAIPLVFKTAADFVAQMVVLDPSTSSGMRLSQAMELHVAASLGHIAGPTADDTPLNVSLVTPPAGFCGNAPASLVYFGRHYTSFNVEPNGRITFGSPGAGDFTPTVAEAASANPSFGFWVDFAVNQNAPVSHCEISIPSAGIVRVDWFNVPYFNQPTSANCYIEMDSVTGAITMGGLNSLPFFQAGTSTSNACWMGLSRGNDFAARPRLGATDGGPTAFGVGTFSGPANATTMVYAYGQPMGLSGGADTLHFVVNRFGNYDWFGR